jgi:hypothetical protein
MLAILYRAAQLPAKAANERRDKFGRHDARHSEIEIDRASLARRAATGLAGANRIRPATVSLREAK